MNAMEDVTTSIGMGIETRRIAIEAAALVCDDHADFLKKEAHAGGDWQHLMDRHEEAVWLARQIRKLKDR